MIFAQFLTKYDRIWTFRYQQIKYLSYLIYHKWFTSKKSLNTQRQNTIARNYFFLNKYININFSFMSNISLLLMSLNNKINLF